MFYRLLSTNPVTVGLESPIFQAAGKITRLLEDLLISGTLYNAPFIMSVIVQPPTYENVLTQLTVYPRFLLLPWFAS